MKIGSREIGGGEPCLVVAEIGMAHDGSIGMAHAYVDAVAKAGAGAVKFQCHHEDEGGQWRQRPKWCEDDSRADYWRRTSFQLPEWDRLATHAKDSGLVFLCSTFSKASAMFMNRLLPAWKIASGQVTNTLMLDYMAANPKPTIISKGMCDGAEYLAAWRRLGFPAREDTVIQLHSTSLYPTPLDQVGLSVLEACATGSTYGLSDHSGTIWPSLAAATMGAAMVEVHVTFSRDAWGPDTASSITLDELRLLCEGIEAIRQAQLPVDREALLKGPLKEARRVYMGVRE